MPSCLSYIAIFPILVLPESLTLYTTPGRTSLDYEVSLCTRFFINVHRINSSKVELSVHLSAEFWEAVRYFGVKDVNFVPIYSGECEDVELPSIHCPYKMSKCSKQFSNEIKILDKEIKVYLQCKAWSSFCDLCEPAMLKNVYQKPTLPTTTLRYVIPSERLATTIGISVTSVFLIMIIIMFIVRKMRINVRSRNDEETTGYYQLNTLNTRNDLLVLCTGKLEEEMRRELFTYLSVLHHEVIFIEEHLRDISLNVNDWMGNNVNTCSCILIVYSKTPQENNGEQDNTTGIILQRIKSITNGEDRPKLAIISCSELPAPLCCNLLKGFHIRVFSSDFKTSDTLLKYIKDKKDIRIDLGDNIKTNT